MNTVTDYFLADALGSVRQLTDAQGAVTLAKSYQPYGETLSSVGSGSSPFAFTGEQTDVSGMTYLRARYYSSGDGRFLTRDTWMGEYNRPLSLNRWGYVEGNPINLTDPSGYASNCSLKGTCGPDVTEWYREEMSNHYSYGVEIKNKIQRMKALAVTVTTITPCPDIFALLSFVAIETPFYEIVREFNIPKTNIPIGITPLFTPNFANTVIDALGALEYALYGVSVYYGQLNYITNDPSCNTGGCGNAVKGISNHQVISLCGQCRDSSDLGNIMFGLGGAARGYSWSFVLGSAVFFNRLDGDTTPWFVDGGGALPGWTIGRWGLYRISTLYCLAHNVPVIGRDSRDQINGCQACNSATTNLVNKDPSSLENIKGGSTIKDLQSRLNNGIDDVMRKFIEFVSKVSP